MLSSIYLLRPGEFQHDPKWDAELLTDEGRAQTIDAGRELLSRGLGKTAYLLSSSKPAAMQTADRIAEVIGGEAIASPQLWLGSENWRVVNHLGSFLMDCLIKDAGLDPEPTRPYIAVVHEPLIASLRGVSVNHVEPCKVEEFPFDASNPLYLESFARYVLADNVRQARLFKKIARSTHSQS